MPRLIKEQMRLDVDDPSDAYTRVHARLEEALLLLEDIQQPHARSDLARLRDKAQIQLAVEDVICALLGSKGRLVVDP